jgi:hypothetical protein
MDGRRFDAGRLEDYLEGFAIRRFPAGVREAAEPGAEKAADLVEHVI